MDEEIIINSVPSVYSTLINLLRSKGIKVELVEDQNELRIFTFKAEYIKINISDISEETTCNGCMNDILNQEGHIDSGGCLNNKSDNENESDD